MTIPFSFETLRAVHRAPGSPTGPSRLSSQEQMTGPDAARTIDSNMMQAALGHRRKLWFTLTAIAGFSIAGPTMHMTCRDADLAVPKSPMTKPEESTAKILREYLRSGIAGTQDSAEHFETPEVNATLRRTSIGKAVMDSIERKNPDAFRAGGAKLSLAKIHAPNRPARLSVQSQYGLMERQGSEGWGGWLSMNNHFLEERGESYALLVDEKTEHIATPGDIAILMSILSPKTVTQ